MDDPLAPWLSQSEWRGLFVEPQPEQFKQLTARYAQSATGRFVFENVAIDKVEGVRQLHRVTQAQQHAPEISGLASFFPDRALATHGALGRLDAIDVPCVPLDRLLARHNVKHVDLLQIDTEGYDAVVLETINLDSVSVSLIHFEHRHLTHAEYDACVDRLKAHGYSVYRQRFDVFAINRRSAAFSCEHVNHRKGRA